MSAAATPVDRAYVLHSYPYSETSLVLQAWTEKHGRMALMAKGAKRPRSATRSLLVPFQPLAITWFGRGEMKTLKTAESAGPALPLAGSSLLSAFYLNELILKLTHRDDPHEGLFEAYDAAVSALRAIARPVALVAAEPGAAPASRSRETHALVEPVLRRFELAMLKELGFAVELARDAASGAAIDPQREYWYVVEKGPVPCDGPQPARHDAVKLSGLTLAHLERGCFDDSRTAPEAKQLMRLLIHHCLNGQELATRALVRDVARLGDAA